MSYHVIFVKLLSPLFIALCVKCAYVQPVLENIFQMNQKNIKLCHSKCKDLRFCAITIRQNLVSFIVSNATVQFAHVAFLLVNMNITKKIDIWKKMENNKAEIHKFLQELEESFYQNMKQLRLTSLIKKLISRKTHGN